MQYYILHSKLEVLLKEMNITFNLQNIFTSDHNILNICYDPAHFLTLNYEMRVIRSTPFVAKLNCCLTELLKPWSSFLFLGKWTVGARGEIFAFDW